MCNAGRGKLRAKSCLPDDTDDTMFGRLAKLVRVCVVAALAIVTPAAACVCTCNDTCPAMLTPSRAATHTVAVPTMYRGILERHNAYRARHGLPKLKWNRAAATAAASWARNCQFQHESQSKYGENLYAVWGMSDVLRALDNAARAWYEELKYYRYDRAGFSMNTGHFTQVVWKNTKRLGCAAKQCGSMLLVVCRYDPPGNVIGHFRANVPRPHAPHA